MSTIRSFSASDKASQDSSKKNDEPKKENKTDDSALENETAAQRLNRLLSNMKSDEKVSNLQKESLARPRERKKEGKKNLAPVESKENMIEAVKKVASLFGENVKETESELLKRLLQLQDVGQNLTRKGEIDPTLKKENVKNMSLR